MIVYALVPARSGSKGLPGKNIRSLGGHPLLAWAVAAATESCLIQRTFVSTDSRKYADIAIKYGAEAPFLRPESLSGDTAPDIGFLSHAIAWWAENDVPAPDYIALLRPTAPLRDPAVLDLAIEKFLAAPDATSLCSGFELPESPVKNFTLGDDGFFHGLMGDHWLSKRRQDCPKAYVWDDYVDILRTSAIINTPDDIYGSCRLPLINPPGVEIDTPQEFDFVEFLVQKNGHSLLDYLNKRRDA